MRKLTFRGGIHPNDTKFSTNSKPIKVLVPAEIMYFPLSQHIGAPLTPTVSVGDTVKMYQKIADSNALVCAPLHSSVSGVVKDIGMYLHPSGTMQETIVIENDGLDTKAELMNTKTLDELSKEDIIKIVREAGIVGMGGATFPTHIKLSPPDSKKIEYIIVNGAECEPYLTSDHRVMLETPRDTLFGVSAVMKIFSLDKAYIAIEENKPDAIHKLKEKAKDFKGIEIVTLKKKYPQGSEKHIIYAVTKRKVPSGKLPMDVGAIVLNIDTVAAIARAIDDGVPLIRRIVTVTGTGICEPSNFSVRLGTPFSHIIEAAGGMKDTVSKIIMGGPMMGQAVQSINLPVVKSTSALLFLEEKEAHLPKESPCIRCGKCVSVCPMNLLPLDLYNSSKANNPEACRKFNILDCVECGSCSYICPAKRQLVQTIRVGKLRLQQKLAKEKEKNNGK